MPRRVSLLLLAVLWVVTGAVAQTDCGEFDAYEQPFDPGNFGTGRQSDAEGVFAVNEDIVDAGGLMTSLDQGLVHGLRFWGYSAQGGGNCEADNSTPFVFTFRQNDETTNTPGTTVASVTTPVDSWVDTGIAPQGFAKTVFQFDVTFVPPIVSPGDISWIRIVREVGVPGCVYEVPQETLAGSYDDLFFQEAVGNFAADAPLCVQLDAVVPVDLQTFSVGDLR